MDRKLRFEQPQLGLETLMQASRFALQLLTQRRSSFAHPAVFDAKSLNRDKTHPLLLHDEQGSKKDLYQTRVPFPCCRSSGRILALLQFPFERAGCTCCGRTHARPKKSISGKHLGGQWKKLQLNNFLLPVTLQNCTG